jgi:hypothetical protein
MLNEQRKEAPDVAGPGASDSDCRAGSLRHCQSAIASGLAAVTKRIHQKKRNGLRSIISGGGR